MNSFDALIIAKGKDWKQSLSKPKKQSIQTFFLCIIFLFDMMETYE